MSEVARKRLINRINILLNKEEFFMADLDELKILHTLCRKDLPPEFNSILDEFSIGPLPHNMEQLLRLQRVLQVCSEFSSELAIRNSRITEDEDELNPKFALSQSDKHRVIDLCSAMRKIIHATTLFDQPHKVRLLNRIAAIELEVEKPRGMFDVIRGGISDLGETLGKFGTDIKPLTDRMNEVVSIARKATKDYDQLPAPEELRQLPAPETGAQDNNEE